MKYEIRGYNPDFIEQQANLIWDVSGKWKYPYATSADQIRQSYSSDSFDPSTRFYAFDTNNKMIGYITSAVHKDAEKGDYGTVRFPVVVGADVEIEDALMEKAMNRFKELGITKIRASAYPGLGNTLDLAKKYDFEPKTQIFIIAKENVNDIDTSIDISDAVNYEQNKHGELVKSLFMQKMGMPEQNGLGYYNWAVKNKERKEKNDPHMTSWKLIFDNDDPTGFCFLMRSDAQPVNGNIGPTYINENVDSKETLQKLVTAHIKALKPHGLQNVGAFLTGGSLKFEKEYSEIGFKFDKAHSYEKILE